MTSPRPHPSGASSVLAFISFLSSFRTFFASLAPRRAARAEPSLRGPAARRGRPPALRTLASSPREVRAPGPGPGAAAAGRRPCADPPARSVARARAAAPARPASPGSRRGRPGAARRGSTAGSIGWSSSGATAQRPEVCRASSGGRGKLRAGRTRGRGLPRRHRNRCFVCGSRGSRRGAAAPPCKLGRSPARQQAAPLLSSARPSLPRSSLPRSSLLVREAPSSARSRVGRASGAQPRACSSATPPAPGPFGVRADPGSSSREMKEGSFALAASPALPPQPPPLQCTFKWKIFRSQQKHCVQKRLSRSYHQTREPTLPGKLPLGRKYWGICLFIGGETIPRRAKKSGDTFSLCSRQHHLFSKSRGPFERKFNF